MSATDTAHDLAERLEPAKQRARALRSRAEAEAEDATETVEDAVKPIAGGLASGIGSALRSVLRVLAVIPGLVARVLDVVSSLLDGFAGAVGAVTERGREVASKVEPPTKVRRRRKATVAAWFLGGFAAGTATGWVLHSQMSEDEPPLPPARGAAPDGSTPIDARNTRVS